MRREINLFEGLTYSRSKHARHLEVLDAIERIIVICAGRRWGKTYTAGLLFLRLFFELLAAKWADVERGVCKPWAGLGMSRAKARRQKEDVVQAVIIAPQQKHIDEIRGNLENRLWSSGAAELLHPDPHLAAHERPAETWFVMGRAAGVIRYFVASRVSQLVGSKASLLWLNECGEQSDATWRAVKPLMWEQRAAVIAEGTPAFDEGHFFTGLAVSGLPDGHERADRQIAKRNPEARTFLASSLEAYSETAREEAEKDFHASGEDSIYSLQMILGDWRMPANFVFRWQPERHITSIKESRGIWTIVVRGRTYHITARPRIVGGIDWFRGSAPAGAVVTAIWRDNPLSPEEDDPRDRRRKRKVDPRPLVAALDEFSTAKGEVYSDEVFIERLVALQRRWGVGRWYQDPFSPKLTRLARRQGLSIDDTDPAEKAGRLALVSRLLHCTAELEPALIVSPQCKTLADQLSRYRWARKRDGRSTGKPIQYNDWLIDGLAYIVPQAEGVSVAGGPFR